jgi:hypothetical protein
MVLFPNNDNVRCTNCGKEFTADELAKMARTDPYGYTELVRITGTCPTCWEELFPEEDE